MANDENEGAEHECELVPVAWIEVNTKANKALVPVVPTKDKAMPHQMIPEVWESREWMIQLPSYTIGTANDLYRL
jgi:hypothetical protein